MKDALGHGSDAGGGSGDETTRTQSGRQMLGRKPTLDEQNQLSQMTKAFSAFAAHQTGVESVGKMRRAHFEEIASGLQAKYDAKNPAAHAATVSRVADALAKTNPQFNRARFISASQPGASMTRGKGSGDHTSRSSSRAKVSGRAANFLKKHA